MIQKENNKYFLVCDNCGYEDHTKFSEFMAAVEWKKENRNLWRSKRNEDGDWVDLCSDCYENS